MNSVGYCSSRSFSHCASTGRKTPILKAAVWRRRRITMATPWKIHIDANNTGLWKVKQTDEAAKKATELLQKDLEARTLSSLALMHKDI